jgi:hypothetical protein
MTSEPGSFDEAKLATTQSIVPAAPGYFYADFYHIEDEQKSGFLYEPIIAWVVVVEWLGATRDESRTKYGSPLTRKWPVTLMERDHADAGIVGPIIKTPDGKFVFEDGDTQETEAKALSQANNLRRIKLAIIRRADEDR